MSKGEAEVVTFSQLVRMTVAKYSEVFWEKSFQYGFVYQEFSLKRIFNENLHFSMY